MVDPYVYPGTNVLRNKFNCRDEAAFLKMERFSTMTNAGLLRQRGVTGDFSPDHVRSIHRELFGDIYDWAGEFRTILIWKGGTEFAASEDILKKLLSLRDQISGAGFFQNLNAEKTADGLAGTLASVNLIHPFREGNGRTQRIFLEQLALNAGWDLNLSEISENDMRNASMAASRGNVNLMRYLMKSSMTEIPDLREKIRSETETTLSRGRRKSALDRVMDFVRRDRSGKSGQV